MLEIDQTEFRLWARYVYDILNVLPEPAKSDLIESYRQFEPKRHLRSVFYQLKK